MTSGVLDTVERSLDVVTAYLVQHDMSRLADDATFVDASNGMSWTGREAIGGMLAWLYQGVFDAHVEDQRLIVGADGRQVVLEATFVGVHRGEFAGVPATGREVRVPLVVLYDMADGRITGARLHFGLGAFLAQATA